MMTSRASLVYLHDIIMAALSLQIALLLRLGDELFFQMPPEQVVLGTALFTFICAVVFRMMGLYQGVWRYASTRDMANIARAVTLAILIFLPLMFFVTRLESLPRSLPILNWFVLAFLLGAPRFAYRLWRDRSLTHVLDGGQKKIPVLLAGSGDAAETFIRATERNQQSEYSVIGLVSEKPQRVGMRIRHAPVLGTVEQLPDVLRRIKARGGARPRRLILTRDDMPKPLVRQLLEQTQSMGLTLARLPQMTELREGVEDEVKVRPIAIEDLLGRAQSTLDRSAMAGLIKGRRILVTGAGGSIGSELARQIAALDPAEITLVEASEFALYSIDMELSESFPELPRKSCLGDVRNRTRLDDIFAQSKPELVVHAAALKHVPLVEANPLEGMHTNTLGTRNVGETCRQHGVALMVMISTDKAVNPTNVMGATKRMAELYCQAADLAGREQGVTRFVTVRFGNVLGSTGSVVPLFRKQLERGGPLTVTHPDMTRYFMTIREAVELVLQASALGAHDDAFKGRIFVLDMGEPITFSGLRPGEKLFEEIFHGAEPPLKTHHEGILISAPRLVDQATLALALERLEEACHGSNLDQAMQVLKELVPEYGPSP
jgi:O-antigen biosynthesis protein WbqV